MGEKFLNKPSQSEIDDDHRVEELRVLAFDAQICSLRYLSAVLHNCNYKVKTTASTAEALEILSTNKHGFDIALVDVDSDNLSGFKLLEIMGLEMYLTVIMVTGDGSPENICKGLVHGAVDYIIKPFGVQQIKDTICLHVTDLNKRSDSAQSSNYQETADVDQNLKPSEHPNAHIKVEARVKIEEDEANTHEDYAFSNCRKKKRVVWTPELDAKFVKAVQILESSNSMVHPKRILAIMNEPGLSRQSIASHLQKYRRSLNKHKAEMNQQGFELEKTDYRGKGVVNGLALPSFNQFPSFNESSSIFLGRTGRDTVTSPYGISLDPKKPLQSLLYSCLDVPNFQTPGFKSFDDYNYCLETNIQPHNLGSQPVPGTTSQSAYFHDVVLEPSIPSSAPFYPSPNRFLAAEADVAFHSPFAVPSIPNQLYGGIPNYSGFSMSRSNNVQYPGSTVSTRNGKTEVINLDPDDEDSEIDYNQVNNSLCEGDFDFYSLFNDD